MHSVAVHNQEPLLSVVVASCFCADLPNNVMLNKTCDEGLHRLLRCPMTWGLIVPNELFVLLLHRFRCLGSTGTFLSTPDELGGEYELAQVQASTAGTLAWEQSVGARVFQLDKSSEEYKRAVQLNNEGACYCAHWHECLGCSADRVLNCACDMLATDATMWQISSS